MADEFTVKIEGLAELERNMNALAEDVSKKYAVDAVKAGERVLRDAIVASAHGKFTSRTGTLFANIRTKLQVTGRGVKGATVKAYIYLQSDGFYGRFWELGFRHIGHGKGLRWKLRHGVIGGKPMRRAWMVPGLEQAGPAALDALVAKLREPFSGSGGGGAGS